jgi:subtilisin family serine protease
VRPRTSTPRLRLICLVLCLSLLMPLSLFTRSAASGDERAHGVTNAPPALPSKTSATTPAKRRSLRREDEVLVRFRGGISEEDKDVLVTSYALKRSGKLRGMSGVERLSLLAGQTLDALLPALQSNPSVEFAEPNFIINADHPETLPNDPRFPSQLALGKVGGVNAAGSRSQTRGSQSTVIAVIDSGVDFTHHDLRDNQWTNLKEKANGGAEGDSYSGDLHGWDWVANSAKSNDESGHGTAVAGIIAATGNNGEGMTGVMWRASLMSLRVLDKENKGSVADAVEAIDYAVANGAHIINCSWGLDEASIALKQALRRAVMSNVTVVCSAGNGSHDLGESPRYPTSYDIPFVISVASTGRTDELTSTSNWGAMHVAVGAPGEEQLTTKAGGGYATFSGTSAAAAVVSGVAGLVRTLRPRLSAERTQQMILVGARKVSTLEDRVMSNGVVDAAGALGAFRLLKQGEGPDDGADDGARGVGGDGTLHGSDAEASGATATEKALKAQPPGLRQSDAYDLPDLDSARSLPGHDPQAIPPVPSTRRRCPPSNRRCNATGGNAPQPTATPTPSTKPAGHGNSQSLAYVSMLSVLAVFSSAMNGGRPVVDVRLLDYFASYGG